MKTAQYTALRDDGGIRSLSTNEQQFLLSCALRNETLREDGRGEHDMRKIRLKLGRWDNGAECTVQWGVGTRVTSLCSAELVPPSPDRPNEGMVSFTVDLSPMAGPSFRQAPPVGTAPSSAPTTSRGPNFSDHQQKLLSNRILRSIERIILIGGALDSEALVLLPAKWVWRITIALTVLDDGGNILDACILAAVGALRHYRKPHVIFSSDDVEDNMYDQSDLPTMVPSSVKEPTPLPLHHTPLSVSFALIGENANSSNIVALLDPSDREELLLDNSGFLTIAMNIHSEVCLLDYGGGCELTPAIMKDCWRCAEASIKDLCRLLEGALENADVEEKKDRLKRLQQLKHHSPFIEASVLPEIQDRPFMQQSEESNPIGEVAMEENRDHISRAQTEADETYHQMALDYSIGHAATSVREDKSENNNRKLGDHAGSLMASMLKSVNPEKNAAMPNPSELDPKPRPSDLDFKGSKEEKRIVPATESDTSFGKDASASKSGDQELVECEEEPPVLLRSEYDTPPAPKDEEITEEDVTDLSMAIKKSKKKSKKKKK